MEIVELTALCKLQQFDELTIDLQYIRRTNLRQTTLPLSGLIAPANN